MLVMRDLAALQLRVPHDVSVAGFDGVSVGALTAPALSTVMQPSPQIAATAVDLLLKLIAGERFLAPALLHHTLRRRRLDRAAARSCAAASAVLPPRRRQPACLQSDEVLHTHHHEATMNRRHVLQSSAALGVASAFPALSHAQQQRAICYNCPPEWADWGGMLKLISQKINIAVPPDNKNSGQSLAALIAEKANPVADVVYLGGQVGPQAKDAGVLACTSRSAGTTSPSTLKDPGGLLVHDPLGHARACSSTRRRCAASPCRSRGKTCSSPSTRAWSAT